jgi:hypothetical protein
MVDTVKAEEAGHLNGWYSRKKDAIAGVLPLPAKTATIRLILDVVPIKVVLRKNDGIHVVSRDFGSLA